MCALREQIFELVDVHILDALDLVAVGSELHIAVDAFGVVVVLDEQHVVDFVLAKDAVVRHILGLVLNSRNQMKHAQRQCGLAYAELVVESAACSSFNAEKWPVAVILQVRADVVHFVRHEERVTAARVCPMVRISDLLRRALLQQQPLAARVEEEHAEGSMQHALVDVRHKVTVALARRADHIVLLVDEDALIAVQESQLSRIECHLRHFATASGGGGSGGPTIAFVVGDGRRREER